jgi:hypothetical protein
MAVFSDVNTGSDNNIKFINKQFKSFSNNKKPLSDSLSFLLTVLLSTKQPHKPLAKQQL